MKIINASVKLLQPIFNGDVYLELIEEAGRVCYKSEDKITPDSAKKFVKMLIDKGHHAMLELAPSIRMKFICDRGVSHEIVRHRLFSFAQESTRYCNYGGKDIEFILPCWFKEGVVAVGTYHINSKRVVNGDWDTLTEGAWFESCLKAEETYDYLMYKGWQPQQARSVLPNSLKTEIIVSGNVREWRHFFTLRTDKTAHPQMQEVAKMALRMLREEIPILFDDVGEV